MSTETATSPTTPTRTGRPRTLDDAKRREVCALISAGCALSDAARYVGCSATTIKRECHRDPEFDERVRRAEMSAAVHPLAAMNKAAATHWRAAAWMLERAMPKRYGRPQPKRFDKRDARRLASDLVEILRGEIMPDPTRERLEAKMVAAIQYSTRIAFENNRSGRNLRAALKYLDAKNGRAPGPADLLCSPGPTLESISNGTSREDLAMWRAIRDQTPANTSPPSAMPSRNSHDLANDNGLHDVAESNDGVRLAVPRTDAKPTQVPRELATESDNAPAQPTPFANNKSVRTPAPPRAPIPARQPTHHVGESQSTASQTTSNDPSESAEVNFLINWLVQELTENEACRPVSPLESAPTSAQKNAPPPITQNSQPTPPNLAAT